MRKLTAAAAGAALMLAGTAYAQTDAINSITGGWSGSAAFGTTIARGDVEADSTYGNISLSKTAGKWEHLVFGSLLRGSSTVITVNPVTGVSTVDTADNAERILLGYQPKFYWRPRTYFFGILDFEQDEPGNIDSSTRQIVGIGHKFWERGEGSFFNGEVGIGNRSLEPVEGANADSGILYLGLNYRNQITETSTFYSNLRADFGDDNESLDLNLGYSFKVSSRLAVNLSLLLYGNTGLENLDNPLDTDFNQVFTAGLVFDI